MTEDMIPLPHVPQYAKLLAENARLRKQNEALRVGIEEAMHQPDRVMVRARLRKLIVGVSHTESTPDTR